MENRFFDRGSRLTEKNFAGMGIDSLHMRHYNKRKFRARSRKGERMKELNLIVRAEKLEEIKKILIDEFGCGGMTVSNVLGCGGQKGFAEEYVGTRTHVNLLPKLDVRVVVRDEDVETIIDKLCEAVRTGHYGDGKIFVREVLDAVRIRTHERGEKAI